MLLRVELFTVLIAPVTRSDIDVSLEVSGETSLNPTNPSTLQKFLLEKGLRK